MSFVADHLDAMDLCKNPEWQLQHGFTAWQGPRPVPLQPVFSFARSSTHADILAVPLEQYNTEHKVTDLAWADKPHNKLVWRGGTTGIWFDRSSYWRSSQRSRLHFLGQDSTKNGASDRTLHFADRQVVEQQTMDYDSLRERYLDVGYAGSLSQCSGEDGSCGAIPPYIDFKPSMDWVEQNEYKYMWVASATSQTVDWPTFQRWLTMACSATAFSSHFDQYGCGRQCVLCLRCAQSRCCCCDAEEERCT